MPVERPRLLFIARAFPPTIGGMEAFAAHLSAGMEAHADVTLLANRRGKKALPAFLPYALARALWLIRRGDVDAVHLADALLAPVGAAIKRASHVPVTASAHGLDVMYGNPAYRRSVLPSLRTLDLVICNSAATQAALHARTGTRPPSSVVPLGVNPLPAPLPPLVEAFDAACGGLDGKRVLLTVARLVERKGVAWFVRNVLPALADETVYAVVGDGPQRNAIESAATDAGVLDRIRLLGRVDDGMLAAAYARADLFVMPNVPVAGDMEGFGLVALEAAASGLPVVASRIEGIAEAVHDGRNGRLVEPEDADAFVSVITSMLAMPADALKARAAVYERYTRQTFGWDRTSERYVDAIRDLVAGETSGEQAPAAARAA